MDKTNEEFNSYEDASGYHGEHGSEIYIRTSEVIMTKRDLSSGGGRPTIRIWVKGIPEPVVVYTNEHLTD